MRIRIKYVSAEHDRFGRVRYRFRAPWKRCAMKSRDPLSPEFAAEYAALLHNVPPPVEEPTTTRGPVSGSVEWLLNHYMASPEFRNEKRASTQRVVRLEFKRFCAAAPTGGGKTYGERPAATLDARAARAIRAQLADRPGAANNRIKYLRGAWSWAVETERVPANPFVGIKKVRTSGDGYTAWTISDVERYVGRHPRGTTPYLALMILLFTAFRRSDAVGFGPAHLTTIDGVRAYRVTTLKTGREVVAPLMPQLADAIAASVIGTKTFLVTAFGKPFSIAGFGNWFRDRCDEAGLTALSAHGVRKAAGAILAENGASPHEIMAILGHETERQGTVYTASAERWKLARSAFAKMKVSIAIEGVDTSPVEGWTLSPQRVDTSNNFRWGGRPGGIRTPNQSVMSALL